MPSAARRAPSGLTLGLIDDAAIFPPGLAPLDIALERHRALRQSPLARYIGPFLLRASWWQQFVMPGAQTDGEDVDIVLICRPGEGVNDIESAIHGLTQHLSTRDRIARMRGIELPWSGVAAAQDITALLAGSHRRLTVAFEIDGATPDVDLAAIADIGMRTGIRTLGKFRTGGITPEDSPPPDRLAGVIAAAARLRLPVKFTAGLHHAVTGQHGPGGSTQFGVLNVIAAVHQAVSATVYDGALVDSLSATLTRTDAGSLAAIAVSLDDADIKALRSVFASFGCCGVTEPLAELAELGVIPELTERPQS